MTAGRWMTILVCVAALAGCSKKQEVAPTGVAGEVPKAGASLAYEHKITVQLPGKQIPTSMDAVRAACETQRFGPCNVLRISQDSSQSAIVVRLVPTGVEPLVALAAQGGHLGRRETRAEDLADAVQDNLQKQRQLDTYARRLDELAARKDLSTADLIALGHEQAQVEQQRETLLGEAARRQRRIDTNLLELQYTNVDESGASHRLARSFHGMGDNVVEGVDDAISMLAYGVPFLILALPLGLLWRWAWRRLTRRRTRPAV